MTEVILYPLDELKPLVSFPKVNALNIQGIPFTRYKKEYLLSLASYLGKPVISTEKGREEAYAIFYRQDNSPLGCIRFLERTGTQYAYISEDALRDIKKANWTLRELHKYITL